ncbi:hypothetical protein [Paenibacillus caui]|uniref:hypothetical protein n=1 Tax=Paenibacillus caui TaxID=2873927 RepID=UPI001CA87633|nr:hypothetical protein [Paenibacillus caui]
MKMSSWRTSHESYDSEPLVWRSRQDRIQPVTSWRNRNLTCRYAYSPSADSCSLGEPGQDYGAVAADEQTVRFVLCDGVSLSYRGDFGARILGEQLLRWLQEPPGTDLNQIQELLVRVSQEAAKGLKRLHLPDDLPPLVREVLLEKRKQGTEAMFVCGHISRPRQGRAGRLWLLWQGDIRIRLWNEDGESRLIPANKFQTSERWSSRPENSGMLPHLYTGRLDRLGSGGLIVYSDGLQTLDMKELPLSGRDLEQALQAEQSGGLQDDASVLELSWSGAAP